LSSDISILRESGFENAKLNGMSESAPKTLFFIKNPTANLSAIELFLKKRGFLVHSESDLKSALMEIMKLSPDYIFIAWDHPSDKIMNLPKLILQSMMTTMIAYCLSNDKNQIRKLQSSGQKHKLFPPLSGPAIQRLISKLDKENALTSEDFQKNSMSYKEQHQSNMIQVKSGQKNHELDQFMSNLSESSHKPTEIYIDKGQRAKELRNKQNLLKPSNVMYLAPVQDIVSSTEHKMSDVTKNKLDQKFDEQIKLPLEEMFETLLESVATEDFTKFKNETLENTKYGFCITLEHKTWCGYLIVASEDALDPHSLEIVINQWLTDNLAEATDEHSEILTQGFELNLYGIAFEKFSEQFSDYTKTVLVHDKKTVVSFFNLPPHLMTIQLHELHDMIEILTAEVPISLPVPFDIHLYLPENKKFILYSKKDSLVANIQIDRLKEKKVDKLYSSMDFENRVQQFRAESRIQLLIEKFKDGQNNDQKN
jgi:hypothetical protein